MTFNTQLAVQAIAAHVNGGLVIVQVERLVAAGSLPLRQVHLPAALVDKVSPCQSFRFKSVTFCMFGCHILQGAQLVGQLRAA